MKIVAKPIQMVVWFDEKGIPNPVRFRIINEDQSYMVIKIDKVLFKNTEKLAGNIMYIFRCQSLINNIQKVYEIKYEISTCRWILFKI